MLRPPKRPTLALDTNIVQDNLPVETVSKLYIGSIHAAFNQEALKDLGITHILNASRLPATFPKQFTYLSIDVKDKENANLLSCIPTTNIFIEAGLEAGGVLVHCLGGRSRSAAFITAFLMSSYGWTYEQAYDLVRNARPVAAINKGFDSQLRAYGKANFDVYVAQQILLRRRIRSLNAFRGSSTTGPHSGHDSSMMTITTASSGSGVGLGEAGSRSSLLSTVSPKFAGTGCMVDSAADEKSSDFKAEEDTKAGTITATDTMAMDAKASPVTPRSARGTLRPKRSFDDVKQADNTNYTSEMNKGRVIESMSTPSDDKDAGVMHPKQPREMKHEIPSQLSEFKNIMIQREDSKLDWGFEGSRGCKDDKASTLPNHVHQQPQFSPVGMSIDSPNTNFGQSFSFPNAMPNQNNNGSNSARGHVGENDPDGLNNARKDKTLAGLAHSRPSTADTTPNLTPCKNGLMSTRSLETLSLSGLSGNPAGSSGTISLPPMSSHLQPTVSATGSGLGSFQSMSSSLRSGLSISTSANYSIGAVSTTPSTPTGKSLKRALSVRLSLDPHTPHCRLSSPGSSSVRVIPPLRGLERAYVCCWCNTKLFNLGNVVRLDIDVRSAVEAMAPNPPLRAEDKFGSSFMKRPSSRGISFTSNNEETKSHMMSCGSGFSSEEGYDADPMAVPMSMSMPMPSKTPRAGSKPQGFGSFGFSAPSDGNPGGIAGLGVGNVPSFGNMDCIGLGCGPLIAPTPKASSRGKGPMFFGGSEDSQSHGGPNSSNGSKSTSDKQLGVGLTSDADPEGGIASTSVQPPPILRSISSSSAGSLDSFGGAPTANTNSNPMQPVSRQGGTVGAEGAGGTASSQASQQPAGGILAPSPRALAKGKSPLFRIGSKKEIEADNVDMLSAKFSNFPSPEVSTSALTSTTSSAENTARRGMPTSASPGISMDAEAKCGTESRLTDGIGFGQPISRQQSLKMEIDTTPSDPQDSHAQGSVAPLSVDDLSISRIEMSIDIAEEIESLSRSQSHYEDGNLDNFTAAGAAANREHSLSSNSATAQLTLRTRSHSAASDGGTGTRCDSRGAAPSPFSPYIPYPPNRADSWSLDGCRDSSQRPQSTEKTRWLARIALLRQAAAASGVNDGPLYQNSPTKQSSDMMQGDAKTVGGFSSDGTDSKLGCRDRNRSDEKVAKMVAADDDAMRLALGSGKYVYIEYLDWMGAEMLAKGAESGEVLCHGCQHLLGVWTWNPSDKHSFNGLLDPPVIKIDKNVVQKADMQLDPTPVASPTVSSRPGSNEGGPDGRGLGGDQRLALGGAADPELVSRALSEHI